MMKWVPCLMADGRAKRTTMLSLLVRRRPLILTDP
jgi:hypothetical protein